MKCVYVSGPYSAKTNVERQRNINRAWEVSTQVWGIKGAYALCPHCNSAQMGGATNEGVEGDYSKFIEADLDLIRRCDAVLMMKGWEQSRGARRERDEALTCYLPVFYEEWGGLERLRSWVEEQDDEPPVLTSGTTAEEIIVAGPVS